MVIQLTCVDHRLLRTCQVAFPGSGLGSNCIFCVGDKVANDPVWKTTLKMVTCRLQARHQRYEHAIEAINSRA